MLIIEIEPLENGAHDNLSSADNMPIPDGWAAVPPELEVEAMGCLPYIDLTAEDGKIVGVAQGTIPEPEPRPESAPTPAEQMRADVDYLAALGGIEL